jgi:catechol 2,3-dioxygenase-like lactoylglutathione lyase family enzyme
MTSFQVGCTRRQASMIHALDHIAIAPASSIADYELILGRRANTNASIGLANVRLQFRDDGAKAGLGFAVADMAKAHRLLTQRALLPEGTVVAGQINLPLPATHGVAITLVARDQGHASIPAEATVDLAAAVTDLDHVVIRTPDPERAVALYAGRLGLSLRLDRSNPAWGARLLFFRCDDLIVEVAHDLKAGVGDGPDRLWGMTWRVPAIAAAQARLKAAGVDVSEVRTGRRPGTQVCTLRSHTAGIPTLLISAAPAAGPH